jgi:hypothetical protein
MEEEKNNFSRKVEEKLKARQARWDARQARWKERCVHHEARNLRHGCCGGGCFNFGKLLLGLFIIFAGIFLLLRSLNLIPDNLAVDYLRFWPFLVIAFGLSLLDTRDRFSFVIGLIVFLAVLMMLTLVFWNSISFSLKGNGIKKPVIPVRVTRTLNRHYAPHMEPTWN